MGTLVHGNDLEKFIDYIKGRYECTETKYIHLTRQNKIRQAISMLKHNQLQHIPKVCYNKEEITRYILFSCYQDHLWVEFFKSHGIQPLEISYEQLDRFPRKTLKKVSQFIGIYFNFDSEKFVQTQNTGRLRNAETEEFLMRYLSKWGS